MKSKLFVSALCAALIAAAATQADAQNVPNYEDQGGSTWHVGGDLQVENGGWIDIETGAQLKIAGTDRTGALATAPSAVAAGYKIARGESALGGSNPTAVTSGLSTIVACSVSLKLTTAPGVGTSLVTYGSSSGTLNLYGWKVTNSSTTTMIASTGTETVGWVCVGT